MDVSVEGELVLKNFSPHSLVFLPGLNCVLATNREGGVRYIDVVSGGVQEFPEISLPNARPVLISVHLGSTHKVVAASGSHVGGRSVHKGCVLLQSILQAPAKKKEDRVSIEIPAEHVQTLFKELLKSRSSPAVREIVMQLSQASQRLLGAKVRGQSSKALTASFSGSISKLTDIFTDLLTRMKSSSSSSSSGQGPRSVSGSAGGHPAAPVLPLISALLFRLNLLHPDHHSKLARLEAGELAISTAESKLMHVEALRRISLADWPHDYQWAIPRTMAEAGFYHLASPQGNAISSKGDRVTCFSCRVYLYSWEPTDEPWSEHERHAIQCPFIRGEVTENIPLEETESSCPAHRCRGMSRG